MTHTVIEVDAACLLHDLLEATDRTPITGKLRDNGGSCALGVVFIDALGYKLKTGQVEISDRMEQRLAKLGIPQYRVLGINDNNHRDPFLAVQSWAAEHAITGGFRAGWTRSTGVLA